MKRFDSGEAVAKEMGISPATLKKTFDDYNTSARTKKDPYGKKVNSFSTNSYESDANDIFQFFSNGEWTMNDFFHVAIMTPVLHYTMGGLEIDAESRVVGTDGKPVPGLFAAGEVAGGVHGANRLGGSSLLGCVVFGRVSGDSAAAYLLQTTSALIEKAGGRLGALANQLGSGSSSAPAATSAPAPSAPAHSSGPTKEYTMKEVAEHNTKDDIWVVLFFVLAFVTFYPSM
jgi:hypothetical protein